MSHNHYRQNYIVPILLAILLHAALFAYIFYALQLPSDYNFSAAKPTSAPEPRHIVQAVSVDQKSVEQEVAKIEQQQMAAQKAHQQQQQQLLTQQRALKQQQARTAKAMAALSQERQAQQVGIKEIKQQRLRLARQQAEQELQRKLYSAEQQRQQAAYDKQLAGVVDKYKQLISNAIYPNWLVSQKDRDLSTELLINLSTSGVVLNVSVQKSSGNPAFDRSAVVAVYKSSPLPVPKDAAALTPFKQFKLTLQPKNIVAGQTKIK